MLKVSNKRIYTSWSHLHRSIQNKVKVIYIAGYQESIWYCVKVDRKERGGSWDVNGFLDPWPRKN